MTEYYLDIETTGLEPKEDKIISIQIKKMYETKYNPHFFFLWDYENEKDMIKHFLNCFPEFLDSGFSFIPIGSNLIFDLRFLIEAINTYNLGTISFDDFIYDKPFIDVKYTNIMMNGLVFKGSGLKNFIKKGNNADIPLFYKEKKFGEIEDYVKEETYNFILYFSKLRILLETMRNEFK